VKKKQGHQNVNCNESANVNDTIADVWLTILTLMRAKVVLVYIEEFLI